LVCTLRKAWRLGQQEQTTRISVWWSCNRWNERLLSDAGGILPPEAGWIRLSTQLAGSKLEGRCNRVAESQLINWLSNSTFRQYGQLSPESRAAFEVHNKAYAKIANAKQMTDGVTHIVKYHGDFDDDASLVLTETDFLDRLSFDSPLDIKFRAIIARAKRVGTDRCALRWGSAGGQIVGGKTGSDHRTRCTTGAQRP
jgi:SIR2-like domain